MNEEEFSVPRGVSFSMHRCLLIYIRTLTFIRALSALKNIYGCLEVVLIHLGAVIVELFLYLVTWRCVHDRNILKYQGCSNHFSH